MINAPTQHDDEADPDHDGEGEQVGVDVKRRILRYPKQVVGHHIIGRLCKNMTYHYVHNKDLKIFCFGNSGRKLRKRKKWPLTGMTICEGVPVFIRGFDPGMGMANQLEFISIYVCLSNRATKVYASVII